MKIDRPPNSGLYVLIPVSFLVHYTEPACGHSSIFEAQIMSA